MTELQKEIVKIVDENSGGVKMTALVVALVKAGFSKEAEDIEAIEDAIKDVVSLDILEYFALLGQGVLRHKQFIYRRIQ